jgi:hypothetical protein
MGEFNGPGELGALLVESGRVEPCLVRHLVAYARGSVPEQVDDAAVQAYGDAMADDDGRLQAAFVALVSAPEFLYRKVEED